MFSYELKKGVARTRNAIALMRTVGFPERVVADAADVTGAVEGNARACASGAGDGAEHREDLVAQPAPRLDRGIRLA